MGGFIGQLAVCHGSCLVQASLMDHSPTVRKRAFEACSHIGPSAQGHADTLASAVWDRDLGIRILAAKALGSLGEAALPHALGLAARIRGEDIQEQRQAAAALRYMGGIGATALSGLLEDRDHAVQHLARLTLESMSDSGVRAPDRAA